MPFKGILTTGKKCRITIDNAPTMPGALAFALLWVAKPGAAVPVAVVKSIAPGARWQDTMTIPDAQMLLIDIDLPVDRISSVALAIEQDAQLVANGLEVADTEWTFLVVP